MRKLFTSIIIVGMTLLNIKAITAFENNMLNNKGIYISDQDYERLINLGFTDNEILNLDEDLYEQNKNLTGEIISQPMKSDLIELYASMSGKVETEYKLMNTTIIKLSNGNYRYKVNLNWKKMPATRSYDIIAIGINSANVNIVSGVTSLQSYEGIDGIKYTSSSSYSGKTTTGGFAVFQLPTISISSLETYLYFEVSLKSSSVRTLNAYGDYSHAQSKISLTNSKSFSVDKTGITLSTSIKNYYDSINIAKAVYEF